MRFDHDNTKKLIKGLVYYDNHVLTMFTECNVQKGLTLALEAGTRSRSTDGEFMASGEESREQVNAYTGNKGRGKQECLISRGKIEDRGRSFPAKLDSRTKT